MVLGKLPVPGRPTIWVIVGQGPIALAVGAGGGCLDIFTLLFLPLFGRRPDIYCLKGPLNPKQPTNQIRKKDTVFIQNVHSKFSFKAVLQRSYEPQLILICNYNPLCLM